MEVIGGGALGWGGGAYDKVIGVEGWGWGVLQIWDHLCRMASKTPTSEKYWFTSESGQLVEVTVVADEFTIVRLNKVGIRSPRPIETFHIVTKVLEDLLLAVESTIAARD